MPHRGCLFLYSFSLLHTEQERRQEFGRGLRGKAVIRKGDETLLTVPASLAAQHRNNGTGF